MMETVTEFAGIPLGAMDESRAPFLAELKNRGVLITPTTVSNLRAGRKSGKDTLQKLLCAEMLQTDDASYKDELYLRIASKGVALRKNETGYLSHRFTSVGFTAEIATLLAIKSYAIRLVLKAMRVDLIFAAEEDQGLETNFQQIGSDYILNYTTPQNYADDLAATLRERWQPQTIASFYRLFYHEAHGSRACATWVPYELEIFDLFYNRQNQLDNPLTPFDRMVLQDYIHPLSNLKRERLADKIRQTTGIKADRETIAAHRNVLTFGQLVR